MTASWTTADGTGLRNTHSRVIDVDIDTAERLLAGLGGPDDQIWPAGRWAPMVLDRGHAVGSAGGHGAVRYVVQDSGPRHVRFQLTSKGLEGWHELRIEEDAGGVRWTHELVLAQAGGFVRRIVIPQHDACLEDLLDQVGAVAHGRPTTRRGLRPGVRFWKLIGDLTEPPHDPRPRRVLAVLAATVLAALGLLHVLWALGNPWPASDAETLVATFLGSPGGVPMPGPLITMLVVAALLVAAALVLMRVSRGDTLRALGHLGTLGVGVVLALRAAVGFIVSGLLPHLVVEPYRTLDLWVYSPLCLTLAVAVFVVRRKSQTERVQVGVS
ncbi:DUF3995 domain-containing protein [Microbacterium esteraromaticum]|uniref:DUF3995 domain-containing protein n=1 Tax=Microbacterium esteraromaticum TaxID=57043 RepID=UPI001C96B7C0|nr:DUF3995 domain-containing protein [Microbacterium esteraromaticum]MBY6061399.1 DUF3995 domain-containing protein [Microbacterium esteraromaticum]